MRRDLRGGLSRYLQHAGITVLEVTAPDKSDRRRQGKDDTLDAIDAANAAFSGVRTFTPKSRDGMIEALRVLKTCRKTAISARRVASAYPERYCERPRSPAGAASFHEPDAADPDPGRMAARSDGQRECIIALSDPTDIARTPVSRVDR